jgi:hypothetical protein
MKSLRILAVVSIIAAVSGCASMVPPPGSDDALCQQARGERLRGDPAWSATLDRISSLQTAWYCQNYLMAWDMGDNPGGGP